MGSWNIECWINIDLQVYKFIWIISDTSHIGRLYNGISKSWVALTRESQLIGFTDSC